MGPEIESRQGIGWKFKKKHFTGLANECCPM
jgi:hypothetical protein